MEKEWRENLQKQGIQNREEIAKLRAEVTHVAELRSALKQVQRENEDLKRSCTEQEKVGYYPGGGVVIDVCYKLLISRL